MLVLVYLEGVVVALFTLGYAILATIGTATSIAPAWYKFVFAAGGTWGLVAMWWLLVTTIMRLQKNRRCPVPLVVKAGIGIGFLFALFCVLYPWLGPRGGEVINPFPIGMLGLVTFPCAIAIHLICLLWEPKNVQPHPVAHFLDD